MFATTLPTREASHRSLSVRLDEENLNGLLILCEMLIPFAGRVFMDAVSRLRDFRFMSLTESMSIGKVGDAFRDLTKTLRILRRECRHLGWSRAILDIDTVLYSLKQGEEAKTILTQASQVELAIYAECNHHLFFVLPEKWRRLVENYPGPLFGPDVRERFTRCCVDIDCAGRCLAFGLGTAAVYHLVGIMQEGINAIAKDLGIPVSLTSTWEDIIGVLDGYLNTKRAGMTKVQWKRVEPFYSEAISDLRSVKNAWRNPTMHFTRHYNEAEARKVFDRADAFMRHLATRLKQAPVPK
jgi:hypothetical protein